MTEAGIPKERRSCYCSSQEAVTHIKKSAGALRSAVSCFLDPRVALLLLAFLLFGSPARTQPVTSQKKISYQTTLQQKSQLQKIDPNKLLLLQPNRRQSLHLEADPKTAQMGEPVTLTARLRGSVPNPSFHFFIAGNPIPSNPSESTAVHRFWTVGSHAARVAVRYDGPLLTDSIRIQVDSISLVVDPPVVEVGKPVSFETMFGSPEPGINYRFIFGDNSPPSEWTKERGAVHEYVEPGMYLARGEVRLREDAQVTVLTRRARQSLIIGTVIRQVHVTPRSPILIDLVAEPVVVNTGETVRFRAGANTDDPNIMYRFDFGDGTPPTDWNPRGEARHLYSEPGTYLAHVVAGRLNDSSVETIGQSRPVKITVGTPSTGPLTLFVEKPNANVGEAITFVAITDRRTEDLEFIFDFGDGNQAVSAGENSVSHAYLESGDYTASVMMRVAGRRLPPRSEAAVSIAAPFDWWKYLVAAVALLGISYQVRRWRISLRPTFHAHPDLGQSRFKGGQEASFGVKIRINPNISAGNYRINVTEPTLIRSIRRTNV